MENKKLELKKGNNKIGIVIDNILRKPSFSEAYFVFCNILNGLKDTDFSEEEVADKYVSKSLYSPEMFWLNEVIRKEEVFNFYTEKHLELEKDEYKYINPVEAQSFFYNKEQYDKFMLDSTYILYSKSEKTSKDMFAYFNMMSSKFDLELIEINNVPKKKNCSLNFLYKNPINLKSLVFLDNEEEIDKEEYFYLFNSFSTPKDFGVYEPTSEQILEKLKEIEENYNIANGFVGE